MMELMQLNEKNKVTSLELVEQINFFRKDIEGKNGIEHKNLLAVIRDEFEEEINELKIQPISYKDAMNRNKPMFELTTNQAKQVLVRESKAVRKAVIAYIEKLEQTIGNKITTDPVELIRLSLKAHDEQKKVIQAVREDVEQLKTEIVLSPAQKRQYLQTINAKVYKTLGSKSSKVYKKFSKKVYSEIHKEVKDLMCVSSYMEIPKVKFGTAMTIVMGFELSEELSLMIAGYKSQLKMEF